MLEERFAATVDCQKTQQILGQIMPELSIEAKMTKLRPLYFDRIMRRQVSGKDSNASKI